MTFDPKTDKLPSMKIHLSYLALLVFTFALPRLVSSTTLGLFLEDQIPNYKSELYSSVISRTKIETGSLTSIGSNSSYVLFGSEGAIYGSSFASKNANFRLDKLEFTGVSCKKKSDPSCWKASRIVRTTNQWLICASLENDIEIQRYALSDQGKLQELSDDAKEAFFYCPFHRANFLAVDLPSFSIVMKSRSGFSIEKVFQSHTAVQVQSGNIEQKVVRLVTEFQYKDETWFVYVSQDKSRTQAKVARVCNSDIGRKTTGFIQLNLWTTLAFLTLECYIPGNPDFVFNEMKDAFFDFQSQKVFATFTTSANSIPGSAICQYDIDEIHERFKGDRTVDFTTNNQTIKKQVPEKRVFYSCRDSSYLPDQAREFLQYNQNVKDFYRQQPIFTIMRKNFKFDKINVETILNDNSEPLSNIFHISTDFGSVLKVHNDVPTTTSDWLEFYDVENAQKSDMFESVLTLDSNSLVLTSSDGNILELPTASCEAMSSCRDCFKLSDPRCYWYSSGEESGCRSGIQNKAESSKYLSVLTSDPDRVCPIEVEPTPVVPVSPDKYTSSSTGGGGNVVVVVPTKTTPSDVDGVPDAEKTSKPKPINLQNKTTFALVVALPTFLVGLTLGMGILFLYAYCKANRSGVSDQGHDQNMYDPEYAKDSNVYEDPPTPQSVMMPPPPKHHNTLPIKTSMGPQYFSSNTNPRGFDKDYDLINGLNKDMITGGSPISLPNGHVGMPEPGLGLMHFHPSNGYMAAGPTMHTMANGNLKGMPNPPPVPRRPRNMSSHSTSSDGIDPSMMMDPAHSSRTPHDENRLIYQVPRGNNRFSSHEYDYGDTNFATIPENEEATPMLPQPTSYHDSEQHNSLRRGQTLPRNGNGLNGGLLPDQHIDDTSEIHHNSLPRQVPSQANKYVSSDTANYYLLPLPSTSSTPNNSLQRSNTFSGIGNNPNDNTRMLSPVKECSPTGEFPPPPADLLDSPDHIYTDTPYSEGLADQYEMRDINSSRIPEISDSKSPSKESWIFHIPIIGSKKSKAEN